LIFVSHNVINTQQHPDGYALLKCLRAYLNLTMYARFNVHTMETIAAGEKALKVFSASIKVCCVIFYYILIELIIILFPDI
jgi:hypothetical protein